MLVSRESLRYDASVPAYIRSSVWRYPVKSMAGEETEEIDVGASAFRRVGVYADVIAPGRIRRSAPVRVID